MVQIGIAIILIMFMSPEMSDNLGVEELDLEEEEEVVGSLCDSKGNLDKISEYKEIGKRYKIGYKEEIEVKDKNMKDMIDKV